MKKGKEVISLFLAVCVLTISCFAVNVTYWYAMDGGSPTNEGWYFASPLVGKVIVCQTTADQTIAATGLVYGLNMWNNANFLPFVLTSLAYTSPSAYNVSFQAGDRSWIATRFPGTNSNTAGITSPGELSFKENVYHGSSVKTIYKYSKSSSDSGADLMRIGIVNVHTTEEYKSIGGHELGHVLGWFGHSSLTSQLMHYSANGLTNLTVSTQDKYHIKQFYDLFY